MKRLLTAAVGVPLALAAIFGLPAPGFFVATLGMVLLAVHEYVRLGRSWSRNAPLGALWLLVPAAALALSPELLPAPWLEPGLALAGGATLLSVGVGTLVLLGRTPPAEAAAGLGLLGFGVPYFALPVAALYHLQQRDPWLLILGLAVVWLGDAAAYYCGRLWGRRRMAPTVSPKKTWEGAAAGLATGLVAALVWSWWRTGGASWQLLLLAALTGVAAQIGDLVESLLKRGAGVKDSGRLLPGHGGFLDRLDAMLFAAPVLWLGLELLGRAGWTP